MENELLSRQAVSEESFLDEEVDFRDSAVLSRRDAIKKTLMAVAAISAMMLPMETLADEPVALSEKDEKRKADYERVRKKGLEKIKKREAYDLRFDSSTLPGFYALLGLRFRMHNKKLESAIFLESWAEDQKIRSQQRSIDDYEEILPTYLQGKFNVKEI